ncbi:uncharacterized protein LOC141617310 [Silene latifolia]|uniref:uncharacterized protein LOC141617310 n=1 Tax=Silene latifolia TaxID=37657 RepID=UPI003D76D88A
MVGQEKEVFKFHPLCKPLALSYLCFADDLLLFCKGDKNVVIMLLRAFKTFSQPSGLCMNQSKSCIYSNGVPKEIITEIIHVAGIVEGKLPFRYLGVPISAKRLSALNCAKLVDKAFLIKLKHYAGAFYSKEKKMDSNAYTIKQGYQWLGGVDVQQQWHKFVWNHLSLPKHCFIGWIAANRRLLTKDRLHSLLLSTDKVCVLCGIEDEDHCHLFFKCQFSRRCLDLDFTQEKVIGAMIQALTYKIWEVRNKCRFENLIVRPEFIVKVIKEEVMFRVLHVNNAKNRDSISQWLK